MSGNCAACHTGGGIGASNHATALTMAFPANVNANSGPAAFNGTTCSNVSCHGGLITPAWGDTLNVSTNCDKCHQPGTSEYIGNFSGQHSLHKSIGLICTDCHDMSDNAAHFGIVTTKTLETRPATTLRAYLRYDQTAQSCMVLSPPPPGVQFTGCHGGTENWR
jgi:predicted CxxxxCH...CXXCH cytochrome family protein